MSVSRFHPPLACRCTPSSGIVVEGDLIFPADYRLLHLPHCHLQLKVVKTLRRSSIYERMSQFVNPYVYRRGDEDNQGHLQSRWNAQYRVHTSYAELHPEQT